MTAFFEDIFTYTDTKFICGSGFYYYEIQLIKTIDNSIALKKGTCYNYCLECNEYDDYYGPIEKLIFSVNGWTYSLIKINGEWKIDYLSFSTNIHREYINSEIKV